MIIGNISYEELGKMVVQNDKKIIAYGAGMIGQVIVPYFIEKYNLFNNLVCYVDMDKRKHNTKIKICGNEYYIRTPEVLEKIDDDTILLITNSNFFSVVKFLDSISALNNVTGYIIPIMQIEKSEKEESVFIKRQSDVELIPRTINYCWFGRKEMPDFLKRCISSWEMCCPDYEIVEWNEDNYDVNFHKYTREAYSQGKYGFVSDLARLDILYENGGIYFDTDVMLEKNLDNFLYQEGFVGTEKWGNINTGGGCGFKPKHPMLKKIIDYRDKFDFILGDGSLNLETNGIYETRPFITEGFKPNNYFQIIGNVVVYPSHITHPYDYMSCKISRKSSTISVHHFSGGWMEEKERINRKNTQNMYESILARIKAGGLPII